MQSLGRSAGLLCELAPDSRWLKGAQHCYKPYQLLGSADGALRIAHAVVSKVIEHLAAFEGIPQMASLEESLLEQVSYNAQALHLDRWFDSEGISVCHFDSYSAWFDRLRQIRALTGSRYQLTARVPFGRAGWIQRGILDLSRSIGRPSELSRRVAPLWSRILSALPTRRLAGDAPRGGIWFYSTAYNCTKIALEYEEYFPRKINFLIEDPSTGGKRLSELGRHSYVLYAWARASDIPSTSEVDRISDRIAQAVASVPLTGDEDVLRAALLRSEWWDHFTKRILPFLILHERALQRWCDAVAPEMLVVGNAGYERAVLQSQRAQRIPSLMLQHGIMHWVYAVADQPVTHFLIRGRFFLNLINDRLRSKTVICNYPQPVDPTLQARSRKRRGILFITMPYQVAPLFHLADLREILGCLLQFSHDADRPLLIRVHPLERTSFYQRLVSDLQRELSIRCDVVYSQGPGVEELLASSSVAILYFSTMFLDCLRHGIPIISLDWHSFPNKRHFRDAQIFHFASDLRDLEQLLRAAVDGGLPSSCGSLSEFLAPTKPEEVTRLITDLCQSSGALGQTSSYSASGRN